MQRERVGGKELEAAQQCLSWQQRAEGVTDHQGCKELDETNWKAGHWNLVTSLATLVMTEETWST